MTTSNTRTSDHDIDQIFLDRWSPRAFTGEEIPAETLMSFLEAARWAPSSYNVQPWRFVWARKGTPHFDKLLGLLVEFNQSWCKTASALVFFVSDELSTPPGKDERVPNYTHSFDTGSASMAFALQASRAGWHAHGMSGVKFGEAAGALNVPLNHRVEAAYAVGKLGDPAQLPEQLRERERPSDRKPLAELAFEGVMPAA